MKEFKFGIENFTKEQFFWIRDNARKQLKDLNHEIRELKKNRKEVLAADFIKKNEKYALSWQTPHDSVWMAIQRLKSELRILHIMLGLLKGTPYENMESTSKKQFSESELQNIVNSWIKTYEKQESK